MKVYSPIQAIREYKDIVRLEDAIDSDSPSLGDVLRVSNETKIESYIQLWLVDLSESLNLKRNLNETQIKNCAALICSDWRFKNLKLAEINLIFKKAKTGGYGVLHESLSIDKILGWFNDWFDERCDVYQTRRDSDHHYTKNHSESEVMQVVKRSFDDKGIELPKTKKKVNVNLTIDDMNKMIGKND